MPSGYQPFYATPGNTQTQAGWIIVPSYESIAGRTYPQWAEQYWAWLLSKRPDRNPTQDMSGELCAEDQSGAMWYLAGADEKARVERACTIPHGKYLMLPAIVQIVSRKDQPCSELEKDRFAERAVNSIRADFVTVDGQRFDALYDYHPFTSHCTIIRGTDGQAISNSSVFYGTWVVLNPLPKGDHVVSFGGSLPELNTYRNVTYRLHVE
jgi:hypothetical protein